MSSSIILLAILAISADAHARYSNESEAGVVIATGNSRAQSLSFKQNVEYEWSRNTARFKADFLQAKTLGVLNAKRWSFELRYERNLGKKLKGFLGQGVESDRFAGFLQRHNSDLGAQYVLLREEKKWEWIAELGYRFSRERRIDGNHVSKNQVRAFTAITHDWTPTASSKFWLEYLPNFTNTRDWALNSEISTSAALSSRFSVKIAYLYKYDHQPAPGASFKTDTLYTTSLVAKF